MGERTTFFTIDRKLLEDELWTAEPFTKGQAWVDLIGRASYKDGELTKRGELIITERGLADRWKWPKPKVRRFLEWLEKEGMITRTKMRTKNRSGYRTKINVEKYSIYQDVRTENRTKNRTENRTTNRNNINNLNNISLNTPDGVREELAQIFGDNTDQLLEDVRMYYESHPEKAFPGWKQAAIQFNANQRRWAKPKKPADPMARAIAAFMEETE